MVFTLDRETMRGEEISSNDADTDQAAQLAKRFQEEYPLGASAKLENSLQDKQEGLIERGALDLEEIYGVPAVANILPGRLILCIINAHTAIPA